MSFPRYPKYKDSGVAWLGEVPAHWAIKPLKHFADIDSSGSYGVEPDEAEIVLPVATTAQIDAAGRFVVDRMPPRGFSATERQRYGCSSGDILVVKSSGSATNIISGKAGLVDDYTPMFVFSNFLMRVRPVAGQAIPAFVYALLRSDLTRQRVEQMCSTTTYPNLQVGEYTAAQLPLPPLREQAEIASFLDLETAKIDALVAEQRRLVCLLKEKRQAVISHAVTKGLDPDVAMKPSGVEWLGEVPAHWTVCSIKHFCETITDGAHISPETEDGVFHFVSTKDVGDESIDFENSLRTSASSFEYMKKTGCRPAVGDVLFSKDGTIGRTVVVREEREFVVASSLIIVRPKEALLNSDYLNRLCQSKAIASQVESFVKGAGLPRLSIQNLLKVIGCFPPISEQLQAARFLDQDAAKVDSLTTAANLAIALLQERRTALISAAVTGKIDVRRLTL